MDKINRKNPDPQERTLFFLQQPLSDNVYAVVRITWFGSDNLCAVTENKIDLHDIDVLMEFVDIVGGALRANADVCIICNDDPKSLGFERI